MLEKAIITAADKFISNCYAGRYLPLLPKVMAMGPAVSTSNFTAIKNE